MVIIETKIFSRQINKLLNFEDYRKLQNQLVKNPDIGNIIKGSGVIRKIRWGTGKKGKRGGIRILYYWIKSPEIILMLLAYPKKEVDDLSNSELKILKQIVEKELQ
jgi:mRNA-degrading endonuclease RelE of RelBE toxin-antitoxin system